MMWLELIIAFQWLVYLFEAYLDFRQLRRCRRQTVTTALTGIVDQETFRKAQVGVYIYVCVSVHLYLSLSI